MPDVSLAPGIGIAYQGFLANGLPNNAGKIRTFLAGTTTPAATYTSSGGVGANTNPIVLNADGRTPQEVWLDSSLTYKFQLEDSAGNVLGTFDNVEPPASLVGLGGNTGPAFLAQRANPGYQQLPSGILLQWGISAAILTNANAVIALPLAYPTSLLGAFVTPVGSSNSATPVSGATALTSASTFTLYNKSASTETFRWLTIGY